VALSEVLHFSFDEHFGLRDLVFYPVLFLWQ
jgi:hypothetical protein